MLMSTFTVSIGILLWAFEQSKLAIKAHFSYRKTTSVVSGMSEREYFHILRFKRVIPPLPPFYFAA
jgi:hypothetical protein